MKTKNEIIHKSLLYMASQSGRQKLDVTLEELAKACDIPLKTFVDYFRTAEIDELLTETVHRMSELFIHCIHNPVTSTRSQSKNQVKCFLNHVESYFQHYPEAGYLFTMCFLGDIATSDIYVDLQHHFKLWQETLEDCLATVVSKNYVNRLTDTYLVSLKGQLQLANWESISMANYHAESFLTYTLRLI